MLFLCCWLNKTVIIEQHCLVCLLNCDALTLIVVFYFRNAFVCLSVCICDCDFVTSVAVDVKVCVCSWPRQREG